MTDEAEETKPSEAAQLRKLVLEAGPLLVLFVVNLIYGIIPATAAFMVATLVALVVSYAIDRYIPKMPLIAAGFVAVFGGLTLWFNDDTFIKIKPTVVSVLFGGVLLGGYVVRSSPLKLMLGTVLELTEQGWRTLTLRWALFFFFLAVVNELVWRNFSTDAWVSFKVFGILPLTMVFAIVQTVAMQKYDPGASGNEGPDSPE
ncbi:MAG: septation protein A [Hyphomicrobiales bacterium]